ncbi:hypothetical protein PLANPX_1195 [Lacipirellula parvula]|uniref:Uncharacterized protein n=1 Tax=Lacipirellula parvula TaxID=2650471 RepID=A0A5K7XB99_9BACT|nr:hypothetical protein PLANPX_1195 [Lacipirellula parvula]
MQIAGFARGFEDLLAATCTTAARAWATELLNFIALKFWRWLGV